MTAGRFISNIMFTMFMLTIIVQLCLFFKMVLNSVSPSHFYYGAAPCPFSPAPCPFSQRHALFLNLHSVPYILVKSLSKSDKK